MSLGRSGISHAMKIDSDNIAFVGVQQEGKYKTNAWSLLLLRGDTALTHSVRLFRMTLIPVLGPISVYNKHPPFPNQILLQFL